MSRKAEREMMMKMIFQMDAQNDFGQEIYDTFIMLNDKSEITDYFRNTYKNIVEHIDEIDAKIESNSIKWKLSRLPKVDLAILRVSAAEILYDENIPVSVSINEAVMLAKNYSTDKSSKFINGLLGNLAKM